MMRALKLMECLTVLLGFETCLLQQMLTSNSLLGGPGIIMMNLILSWALQLSFQINTAGCFRSGDAGLWCCCLLPVIATNIGSPDTFMTLTLVPVTFLQYLLLQSRSLCRDGALGLMLVYIYCLSSSMATSITDIFRCVLHFVMLFKLPRLFKASFTFGEASLVSQLLTYFFHSIVQIFFKDLAAVKPLDVFVGILFVSIVAIVTLLWVLQMSQSSVLCQLFVIGLVTACFILGTSHSFIGLAQLTDLIVNLLWTQCSILLLLYWVFCTALSISVVCYYGSQSSKPSLQNHLLQKSTEQKDMRKEEVGEISRLVNSTRHIKAHFGKIRNVLEDGAKNTGDEQYKVMSLNDMSNKKREESETHADKGVSTSVRKYFHLVMLCVYVPGLLYNQGLLYLASVAAWGLLVVTEELRVLNYPVVGVVIDSYLKVFVDQQDPGDLILTPIYLLVGCSLPLWMAPTNTDQGTSLLFYAGLVSVGVGDGAASIAGRRWGSIKWPGSSKSVQGTCAAIISQIVAIQLLGHCGVPDATVSMATMMSVILTSCLEAFTSQIDNLVVPVFGLMLFSSTSFQASNSPNLFGSR